MATDCVPGDLSHQVKLVRKKRAVGLLYEGEVHRTTSLSLDELALQATQVIAC